MAAPRAKAPRREAPEEASVVAAADVDPEAAPAPASPAVPGSDLPLELLATVASARTSESSASILDREQNTVDSYRVGDAIRPGVVIDAILRREVVLRREQAREALRIGDAAIELTEGPTPGVRSASVAADLRGLLMSVPPGAQSVGRPNAGALVSGVQLPENPALYTRRLPALAWGSTFAITRLQEGVARFRRDSGFRGELAIGGISKQHGGPFSPHKSHQSGRDVDITLPRRAGAHDWDATWSLVEAFIETGAVERIFLDHGRQRGLYEAARRAGVPTRTLERVIQYPRGRGSPAIVQHVRGHAEHIHVRFRCGPTEARCESWIYPNEEDDG
ncbi:MAG: penicillin-insensitive murein endopeptidase [Nannocystaceae bacterium]